jgi:hypothetical protein
LNTTYAKQPEFPISIEETKYIVPQIKAAEKRVKKIKVESESWVEEKMDISDPCENWKKTSTYISATAWYEGKRGGKIRVDFHKEVLKWTRGEAPYLENNYSASFDGKHGRYVHNSTSHSGKVFHKKKYNLLPDAPHQLKSRWYQKMLGINASINFHFHNKETTFYSLLEYAIDPKLALKKAGLDPNIADKNIGIKVTFAKIKNTDCINISLNGGGVQESWWLDPNRGYALLKYEKTKSDSNGNKVIVNSIDVIKLDKVAEDLWWPVEAYFISVPFGEGNPWERIVYRATSVVANDTKLTDNVFTVPIPEGYSIDKTEYKTKYIRQKRKNKQKKNN